MKKCYRTPNCRVHTIMEQPILYAVSGNNGNHKGWDNPNNPHYRGAKSSSFDLDEEVIEY